jgi:hypothetical protein
LSDADCAEERPPLKQATTRETKTTAHGYIRRDTRRRKRARTWKRKDK